MEHRLGAALRSGSSVLTAVISDNTALHTAIQVLENWPDVGRPTFLVINILVTQNGEDHLKNGVTLHNQV